jgi:pyruvate dehydrogenase (quinone)
VVLNIKTDPEVPPLPPHITFDEAVKLSRAVSKGDPDEGNMIVGAARQLVGALLPGDKD